MFSLLLEEGSNLKKYQFTQKQILIGGSGSDLPLPQLTENSDQGALLKILTLPVGFCVINVSNDPFITLNDVPFGKQPFKVGDRIHIGPYTLTLDAAVIEEEVSAPRDLDDADIKKTMEEEPLDLEALFKEVETLSVKKKESVPAPLKDYVIREFDDENESFHSESGRETSVDEEKEEKIPTSSKKTFFALLILFVVLLIGGGAGASIWFLQMTDKSSFEEMQAAAGVSDVAMALTYAQLNQMKSKQQNWSDPEFLKNNLSSLIAPHSSLMQQIDAGGRFCKCAYLLRIYTSSDLSHFLVIAQPAANLFQWLFPKSAIVVDSSSLELRKTNELKTLNRLLVHANMLDETNALEIARIVKQGKLISLSELSSVLDDPQFDPPKALSLFSKDAMGYIYNAPRYHHFGERFLQRAVSLLENRQQPHEMALLMQEAKAITRFPHVVLFTSQGVHSAVQSQKALGVFLPKNEFLIAYLKNDGDGIPKASHLLINESKETPTPDHEEVSEEENLGGEEIALESEEETSEKKEESQELTIQRKELPSFIPMEKYPLPLFLTHSIEEPLFSTERYESLQHVSHKLHVLLHENLVQAQPNLKQKLQKLVDAYLLLHQQLEETARESKDEPRKLVDASLFHEQWEGSAHKSSDEPPKVVDGYLHHTPLEEIVSESSYDPAKGVDPYLLHPQLEEISSESSDEK